jgi:PAT family beta-lactamase induction signal transducer AmpG
MSHRQQATYVGVQGVFWNFGRVIATGLLVSLTGSLHGMGLSWSRSWMAVMGVLSAIMALSFAWHLCVLPSGGRAAGLGGAEGASPRAFVDAFASFFGKKGIWTMIAVVYFYRFGEGLIEKIGPLFLLDPRTVGGLGLTTCAWAPSTAPMAPRPSSWARCSAGSSPRGSASGARCSCSRWPRTSPTRPTSI